MKKNKLFISLALTTLFLSAAAPAANAFADAEDAVDTEVVEEGTEVVSDDPVVPETPAVEEPSNEAEEPVVEGPIVDEEPIAEEGTIDEEPVIDDGEVVEQPGEVDPPAEDNEAEELKTPAEWGLDVDSVERLIDKVFDAMNNPQRYTEQSYELFMNEPDDSGFYVEEFANVARGNWQYQVTLEEAQDLIDWATTGLTAAYNKLVPADQEQPEAQYTTVTIELRGKDKNELLDILTFTDKEIGSELVIAFPHFEGLVTPPNLTITVEEDHQLIVYYQTAHVVTDPDPDGNGDNDGKDDSDNGNDDNGQDTDDNVDPDDNDTSGGNVNTGNGNDTDTSDNTNDADKESNDNSSSSDNEVKETSKPKEEAKKSDDSSDKLYTDAEGLAKTSLSSEKSGPAAIGFVGAVIATIGALALFFFREKKTKA